MVTKSYVNYLVDFKPPNRQNNLFNPNMNNITAIDFITHAQTVDTDGVISRWTCEFPRVSSAFKSKADLESKPWGSRSDPVFIDLWQDSKLQMLKPVFQKGVWYYSGLPLTDHHELAGFENPHRVLQTWLGTEFRP